MYENLVNKCFVVPEVDYEIWNNTANEKILTAIC